MRKEDDAGVKVLPTTIPAVVVLQPRVIRDERGFFLETYQREKYAAAGIVGDFVQDNHSRSVRGTVRGLHAQLRRPQAKLVRVVAGRIFDVALDIRRGSPHFGQWAGTWMSADDFTQIYIPAGFAHGFCVTSPVAEVEYKCTDVYDPGGEISVLWNDPDLKIDWPLEELGEVLLSPKDAAAKPLRDLMDLLSQT